MSDVITQGSTQMLDALREAKRPAYVCTIASSETAAIEGLSIAGASAEMRRYTPPADMECLFYGRARSIPGIAATPDGIPSPVIITMAALGLTKLPVFVVDAGCEVPPQTPYFRVGDRPADSILSGRSVANAAELYERGWHLGEQLAKVTDYLLLAESVPAGTTTALAVMLALGLDAHGKVSSTMIGGANELKRQTVESAFKAADIQPGSLASDPIKAIELVGDPMQPVVAGMALAASREVPVMLAGGTQMAAVAAVIAALRAADPNVADTAGADRLCIGTTRWILDDTTADLVDLARQVGDMPVYAADLDFGKARYPGMHPYQAGLVKEGVGAGGSAIAALSYGGVSKAALMERIEGVYAETVLPMLAGDVT